MLLLLFISMHANGLSVYCPFVAGIVRLQDKQDDAPARKRVINNNSSPSKDLQKDGWVANSSVGNQGFNLQTSLLSSR